LTPLSGNVDDVRTSSWQ